MHFHSQHLAAIRDVRPPRSGPRRKRRRRFLARIVAGCLGLFVCVAGCRTAVVDDRAPVARATNPERWIAAATATSAYPDPALPATSPEERLAAPSSRGARILPASYAGTEQERDVSPYRPSRNAARVEEVDRGETLEGRPVTLLAVLEVVDRDNPQIQRMRHRVDEAYAAWERATALWVPSVRAGLNYNKHEGRIQDVVGTNIETSRGALYGGLGAQAVGAGSPGIPGLYANFHLADAVFQPRIAGHAADAHEAQAEATTNDQLLQAAKAYLDLLRAEQERAVADEIRELAGRLVDVTRDYAETGQGLAADHDRARVELAQRRSEAVRAREGVRVASARLAELLRLDPATPLVPQEPGLAPLSLLESDDPPSSLVALALASRPEVRAHQSLVAAAIDRLERERFAPLLPSVLLGVSQGVLGAGLGGRIERTADRFDGDAVVWWELRNFGLGDAAARKEMRSRFEQARWQEVAVLDRIAREVHEAHAQLAARREQLAIAEEAVALARSSYERNHDRIRNGEGLPLEVLQSLQTLAASQREYVRVIYDYDAAQFTLQWATGQLADSTVASAPADDEAHEE